MNGWPNPGEYWILVPCRHWSRSKNERYHIARIDGPIDYAGHFPCSVYDNHMKRWNPQYGGLKSHWFKAQTFVCEETRSAL